MKSKLKACVKLWLFKCGIGQYCYVLLPYDWEHQHPLTSDFLGLGTAAAGTELGFTEQEPAQLLN